MDKETRGCRGEQIEFRDGQTRGQPSTIHAFSTYSRSVNYLSGAVPAAADPAGNQPHAFPNFLVSPSTER